MYKCTECGTEFEVKPQYCDCGNDTFDEIKPAIDIPKPQQTKAPKPEPIKIKQKKKTVERKSVDILSWAIFATCLMLSLIIIFFVGNPKEKIVEEVQKEHVTVKNIPSIDKFWNNSTVGVKSDVEAVQEPVKAQPVQQIVQKVVAQTQKPIVQPQKPAVQKQKQQTQTSKQTVQKTSAQTKPVQQKVQTTTTATPTAVNTVKPQIPQNTLNVANNQQTAKSQTTTQQTVTQQTVKPVQTQAQTQASSINQKQELTNYKVSLRNTLGRKIDFTKVVGDGECVVSFKINSSGQLINRAFTKQSTNITLNDAVYQAMMSTPSFTRPPELYNNETLNLHVSFKNGNFAISLQ